MEEGDHTDVRWAITDALVVTVELPIPDKVMAVVSVDLADAVREGQHQR